MKVVFVSLFALAGIVLLTFGIFDLRDDEHGAGTEAAKHISGTQNINVIETGQASEETSSYPSSQPFQTASEQFNDDALPNGAPESAGVESQVETFLTSTELNRLHTQLLERFSNTLQPDIGESLTISSLGLDRAQQYQLYLEPADQIVRINNTPVIDLADNPAVGSMLAGPTMKLSVQRGDRVFEIDLSTY